jgi:sugar lactone lactonase YvrE
VLLAAAVLVRGDATSEDDSSSSSGSSSSSSLSTAEAWAKGHVATSQRNHLHVIPGFSRAEDIVVHDHRIYASDTERGAVVVEIDTGRVEKACDFTAVGYKPGLLQSNGIALHDGELFVTDLFEGHVFHCDLKTHRANVLFKHEHGVNDVAIDSHGRIWYTVSTTGNGAGEIFGAVSKPNTKGELWVYTPETKERHRVADGLIFANGIVLNEERGLIYVAETTANRVSRFQVDFNSTVVTVPRETHAFLPGPDCMQLAYNGELIIGSVTTNRVFAVAQNAAGTTRKLFDFDDAEYSNAYEVASATGQDIVAAVAGLPAFGRAVSSAFLDSRNRLFVAGFGTSVAIVHLE